jgi:RNA-binding protein
MALSEPQKKYLRGLGHQLKPVITIADAGLSASLLEEFSTTIDHHELIKVRVRAGDRETRDQIISALCKKETLDLVTRIGNVALVYRRNEEKPGIKLPNSSGKPSSPD